MTSKCPENVIKLVGRVVTRATAEYEVLASILWSGQMSPGFFLVCIKLNNNKKSGIMFGVWQ